MTLCTQKLCKVVTTRDNTTKQTNGSLVEIFTEGRKTLSYVTTILPGHMKGYHLHNVRAARYFPIAGKILVKLYSGSVKEEFILDADNPTTLFIPPFIATGIFNIGDVEAKLINFPSPPYDPNLITEQEEFTEEELEKTWKELNEI